MIIVQIKYDITFIKGKSRFRRDTSFLRACTLRTTPLDRTIFIQSGSARVYGPPSD